MTWRLSQKLRWTQSNLARRLSTEFSTTADADAPLVTESVTCGEELRVRYMLDYRYRTHSLGDFMGIFPDGQVSKWS